MRGAGILVRPNGSESWVRPILEIKEARMGKVCCDHGVVDVSLAEETKPELSNILNFAYQCFGEFMLNAEVNAAKFRVLQVIGNGSNAPE